MFYWFERRGQYIRYEIRFFKSGEYEFAMIDADGAEHVERYTDGSEFSKRQHEFEQTLIVQGWAGPYGRNA